jgi:hypothetical protein
MEVAGLIRLGVFAVFTRRSTSAAVCRHPVVNMNRPQRLSTIPSLLRVPRFGHRHRESDKMLGGFDPGGQ